LGIWPAIVGFGPGQQTLSQAQISFQPSPEGHRTPRIVKGLLAIPKEHVTVTFLAIAAQAGRHAIFRNAQPASAEGPDMVDGLGWITAIEAAASRELVERATPTSVVGFGAEVFQENTIPGQHAFTSIAGNFAGDVSSGNVSLTALSRFAHPSA
jgi:hypothetical protein